MIEVCVLQILSYLCIKDILDCHRLDKRTNELLSSQNEFWVEILLRNLLGVGNAFGLDRDRRRSLIQRQLQQQPVSTFQPKEMNIDTENANDIPAVDEDDEDESDDDDFHSLDEYFGGSDDSASGLSSEKSPSTKRVGNKINQCNTAVNNQEWLLSSSYDVPFIKTIEDAKSLLRLVLSMNSLGQYLQLNMDVVEVSSMDRTVENPLNTLKKSICLEKVREYREKSSHLPQALIHRLGYMIQVQQCSCVGGNSSCYWSSAPNPNKSVTQFITYSFGKKNQLSVIYGFSLTAYQAFFHPNAPIYAPMRARLQILSPNHQKQFDKFPRKRNIGMDGAGVHYCHPVLKERDTDGSRFSGIPSSDADISAAAAKIELEKQEALKSFLDESIAYESEVFEIGHTSEPQYFMLDSKPVLCIGGCVRLVVEGAHQRQNLSEWGVEAHADDYYICLSNVEIFGISLREYNAGCMQPQKVDVVISTPEDPEPVGKHEKAEDDNSETNKVQNKIPREKKELREKVVSIWKFTKKSRDELSRTAASTGSDRTVLTAPIAGCSSSITSTIGAQSATGSSSSVGATSDYEDFQDQIVNYRFKHARGNAFRWPTFEEWS